MKIQNPCIYPPSDPRHINIQELKSAPLYERLRYREITAREWQNAIEEERNDTEKRRSFYFLIAAFVGLFGVIITTGATLSYDYYVRGEGQGKPKQEIVTHLSNKDALMLQNILNVQENLQKDIKVIQLQQARNTDRILYMWSIKRSEK